MIIIPMAGMSSRFFNAGYKKPKYMLEKNETSMFEYSVGSFRQYFQSEPFLFIIKDLYHTRSFVEEKAKILGIKKYYVCVLDKDTRGQAETVFLGLKDKALEEISEEEPITIFNIDTFRPNFSYPDLKNFDYGYLEVFQGEGENWSFAKPKDNNTTEVSLTAEKKQISNLCSTGLYYFAKKKFFLEAFCDYVSRPEIEWERGELYVAPLYNYLINKGYKIHFNKIEKSDVIFCGTPKEYVEFCNFDKN
ncbi:capsular biosynthesis protein [Vibrio vulnificus]|uniref:capsular biosynthesis protein n=1 Tax=Vibrio vulnificus TaxID=672 RepID=UPI0009B70DC2|nr:capsular biosynthesis protein [Vibrio vulnificus]OQK47714.1 hypothetical protein XM74_c10253 [Vibrio vulnificus]POC25992.1 capsular biosynthesis protein [Vibrio vulnificus]